MTKTHWKNEAWGKQLQYQELPKEHRPLLSAPQKKLLLVSHSRRTPNLTKSQPVPPCPQIFPERSVRETLLKYHFVSKS